MAQYHVPSTRVKRLPQDYFLPVPMDLLLGRALILDGICVVSHGGPGDLGVGLIVVAAVDGEVVRAAVAVAPAAAGLVAQGGVAGQVSDVVGDVVVGA